MTTAIIIISITLCAAVYVLAGVGRWRLRKKHHRDVTR